MVGRREEDKRQRCRDAGLEHRVSVWSSELEPWLFPTMEHRANCSASLSLSFPVCKIGIRGWSVSFLLNPTPSILASQARYLVKEAQAVREVVKLLEFPSFPDFLQEGRDTQQEGKQDSLGLKGMSLTLEP